MCKIYRCKYCKKVISPLEDCGCFDSKVNTTYLSHYSGWVCPKCKKVISPCLNFCPDCAKVEDVKTYVLEHPKEAIGREDYERLFKIKIEFADKVLSKPYISYSELHKLITDFREKVG